MSTTPDMAPGRTTAARRSGAANDTPESAETEVDLQKQVEQLRADIKAIGSSLQKLSNEKASEVQGRAKQEYKNLVQAGQHMVEEVSDEFSQVEKQLKDTIRERPLTAVLTAMGLGFLLAVITR